MSTDTRTPADRRYDAARLSPAEPDADQLDAEWAAECAVNHQKVFDAIAVAMESGAAHALFADTLPGRVGDCPIDLLVGISIAAALERNLEALGITREQLFRILEVAVHPVTDTYLMTPRRRMQLLWDGA